MRNARYGSTWQLSETRSQLTRIGEWLRLLGVRLDARLCQELSLTEPAIEPALPSEPGDSKRKKSAQGLEAASGYRADAINLFVVNQVVSIGGTEKFLSVQDRPGKIILMTDRDSIFGPLKLILRALCFYLDCPSNDFSEPDCLRANTPGLRVLPRQIQKVRAALVRPKSASLPWPKPAPGKFPCAWCWCAAAATPAAGPRPKPAPTSAPIITWALHDAYPNGPGQLLRMPPATAPPCSTSSSSTKSPPPPTSSTAPRKCCWSAKNTSARPWPSNVI